VLSAVTTIGEIPDYYFQAIGSGTGAIAAWEANLRFLEDGRYGKNKMRVMLSQNAPFLPIKEAWEAGSRQILPMADDTARKQVEEMDAKVLSNRKPPYSIKGGLFDAMTDAGGEIFGITNQQARAASKFFSEKEGNDLEPAAAVAVASLIVASQNGAIDKNKTVMLNITGGGIERFKNSHDIHYLTPLLTFPINPDPQSVKDKVSKLF